MNKKSLIAYILIVCILVSYLMPNGQVTASYELRTDQNEWKTDKTDELKDMFSLLQRYGFFVDMTDEEQNRIVDFYGINRDLILTIEKSGIGLPDSLNLATVNKSMKFDPDELINLYSGYGNIEKLIEAVMEFDSCLVEYSLNKNVKNQLKHYLIEGYSPKNIVSAYVLSVILGVLPENLLLKGKSKNEGTGADDFYERYEVNNEFLSEYISQKGMTLAEIDSQVTDGFFQGGMVVTSGTGSEVQYTKYLQDPYQFNENTNESISPNNGNLTIENTAVTLKGIQGLDLNITARYRLSDAHLYLYDYEYVPRYYRDALYYIEAFYANDSGYYEPVNNAYNIPTVFSGYNQGDPYFVAVDFEVFFQSGPYNRDGNICYYCYTRQIQWLSAEYSQVVVENGTDSNTYLDKTYNLGTGWGFGFSSIESYSQDKYLHLSTGKAYKIAVTDTAGDSNLKDYPLKDIRLEVDNGTYTGAGGISAYALYYKDGKTEYFDSAGRILAIRDRFSNTVDFTYEVFNGNTVIDKITDTVGRTVEFTYTQSENEQKILLTLPDNKNVTYVLQRIPGQSNDYNLTSIIDAEGRTTSFRYEVSTVAFSFIDKSVRDASNMVSKLTGVTYPAGAQTEYTYQLNTGNLGNLGSETRYRLTGRKETVYAEGVYTDYNVKNLSYTGNHTGYPEYEDPDNLPGTFTYSCTQTDGYGLKVKRTFDNKHNLVAEEVLDSNNVFLSKVENTYNTSTRQLIKNKNMRYNQAGSVMTVFENYVYDAGGYNDLTGYWRTKAVRDPNGTPVDDEHKTTFAYDPVYHILLHKEYKRDESTVERAVNTLDATGKSVEVSCIYEIIRTDPPDLKEKTGYVYDSFGNVIEERRYVKEGSPEWTEFFSTNYSYDDNVPSRNGLLDGLHVTKTSVSGVTDVDGNPITPSPGGVLGEIFEIYEYDLSDNLIAHTDGAGYITSFQYDALNRMTVQTYPDGTQVMLTYDDVNNHVTVTNQNGNSVRKVYDKPGNHVQDVDVLTGIVLLHHEYDGKSRLARTVNADGSSKTVYSYTLDGRLSTRVIQDANNTTVYSEIYTYDDAYEGGAYAKVIKTVPGDSHAQDLVTVEYQDPHGQKKKDGYVLNGVEYLNDYTYDYASNLVQVISARHTAEGLTEPYTGKYEYDYANRVVKEYNIEGGYTSIEYDETGRKTGFTDYRGNIAPMPYSSSYEYDRAGRLLREKVPFCLNDDGNITCSERVYRYDLKGNIVTLLTSNNIPGESENFSRVDYEYDLSDRLVLVSLYDQGQSVMHTQYCYDAAGNKIKMYTGLSSPLTITDPDFVTGSDMEFSVTKYEYDRFGRMIRIEDPSGIATLYEYDYNGNLISSTDRNGTVTTLSYDALGNKTAETLSNPTDATKNLTYVYSYTSTGNLNTVTGEGDHTVCTYDGAGRLSTEQNAEGILKSYIYDTASNKTGCLVTIDGMTRYNVEYEYDGMNRLSVVKNDGIVTALYQYDTNGNRASLEYSNGNVTVYEYNLANAPVRLVNKTGGTVLEDYEYTYALDGNQIQKTESVTGETVAYVYDDPGRLKSETLYNDELLISEYFYTYDDANNRRSKADHLDNVTTYEYDLCNRLKRESVTKNSVIYETSYVYDGNGNLTLTHKSETKPYDPNIMGSVSVVFLEEDILGLMTFYGYDGLNRLKAVQTSQTNASYTYDYTGLRKSKSVNGVITSHVWDGSKIILDLTGGAGVKYVQGINPIAMDDGTTKSFYLFNAHGDVSALTDATGVITKAYDYDAFGNETNPSLADTNPFRYCGEYFDKETGTYYLRSRYYNPVTGRFLTEDSRWGSDNAPLSLNLYTYAHNNPIIFVDQSGHAAHIAIGALVGAVANTGITVVRDLIKDGELKGFKVYAAAFVKGAIVGGAAALTGGASLFASSVFIGSAGAFGSAVEQAMVYGEVNSAYAAIEGINTGLGAAAMQMISSFMASRPVRYKQAEGAGKGFDNFNALKKNLGSAGEGKAWHHIVEQNQIQKSGFAPTQIHNTNNIIAVDTATHAKISGYYNTAKFPFTNGLSVRDWLAGQSFQTQYEFGMQVLRDFGVIK